MSKIATKNILTVISYAVVLILADALMGSVNISSIWAAALAGLVLWLLNKIVKPILHILSLPITVMTLGLFVLVINVIIISLASLIVPGFSVNGFFSALLLSFLLSLSSSIFYKLFDVK